jgi:hypothetical protein
MVGDKRRVFTITVCDLFYANRGPYQNTEVSVTDWNYERCRQRISELAAKVYPDLGKLRYTVCAGCVVETKRKTERYETLEIKYFHTRPLPATVEALDAAEKEDPREG